MFRKMSEGIIRTFPVIFTYMQVFFSNVLTFIVGFRQILYKCFSRLTIPMLVFATGCSVNAQTVSWNAAIERVEASAEEYFEYAVRVGGTSWAGTMYNGYQYEQHQCAILGRMLGKLEAVREIEHLDYPPLDSSSEPHDLLVFSISLKNWVAAARWALAAETHQRINTWNLDCIGRHGISRSMFLESPREEADFRHDGNRLFVYGAIDDGFFDRFLSALDSNPEIEEVLLGSGGGSARDAILAGLEIRRRGLTTTIFGNCFSACPLVFMGGTHRVLWAAPHRLGFHQIYRGHGEPVSLEDPIYALAANYMQTMGIEPIPVIQWMLSAPPHEMYKPAGHLLCAPRVATFVQRICNAE